MQRVSRALLPYSHSPSSLSGSSSTLRPPLFMTPVLFSPFTRAGAQYGCCAHLLLVII